MTTDAINPFVYAGANDLTAELILDYYIEDFNYSRFIQSNRNVLLVGERGCGKSMTLIHNSWPIQRIRASRGGTQMPYQYVGVYVPCNTPLIQKGEYGLLSSIQALAITEHQLVLSLAFALAETLALDSHLLNSEDHQALRQRLEYVLDAELPDKGTVFDDLKAFVQRSSLQTQETVNQRDTPDVQYGRTYSFSTLIVPLLGITRHIPQLRNAHFMFLIDDAHYLNELQRKTLFSWIAYRDHSLFSFKVAIADLATSRLRTGYGGSILEGHDYIRLDMIQPFHNELSSFGRFAQRLIARRLQRCGISVTPDEFFPQSAQLQADLEKAEESVRAEAVDKYGDNVRAVSDYVYKYKRAHYFRSRSPRANRPEYSGFSTLVYLSTGVVRNLLLPCYWMFDKALSLRSGEAEQARDVVEIPPAVQSEIILDRSRRLWDWLREGIDANIEGCSREDAARCYRLFDQLAVHFRERLLHHSSEPRAISFTISSQREDVMPQLERLFGFLKEAQLLYVRSGAAKEKGQREWYHVPNRMLWPDRGLDPQGQHARVSLKAADLWAAADRDMPIPMTVRNELDPGLFDGQ
jgi:hypothetical protein